MLCVAEFGGDIAFLESAQGSAFLPVFSHLRLQYIISDLASARIVERDALLPSGECWALLRPGLHCCLQFLHPRRDREVLECVPRGAGLGKGLEHECDGGS